MNMPELAPNQRPHQASMNDHDQMHQPDREDTVDGN